MPEDIDMIAALRRELGAALRVIEMLAFMLDCEPQLEPMVVAIDALLALRATAVPA